jgi:multimeric flavodoxin WrbA
MPPTERRREPNILIVYHDTDLQIRNLVNQMSNVINLRNCSVIVSTTQNLLQQDLNRADAIIFGTPTYMAGPSVEFKQFMENTGLLVNHQILKNKIAAGFTYGIQSGPSSYSGSKNATLQTLVHFAAQHCMVWTPLGYCPNTVNRSHIDLGLAVQSEDWPNYRNDDFQLAGQFANNIVDAVNRWV